MARSGKKDPVRFVPRNDPGLKEIVGSYKSMSPHARRAVLDYVRHIIRRDRELEESMRGDWARRHPDEDRD